MRYFVLDDAGQQFGPADMPLLQQWVDQGRIAANTRLKNEMTNEIVVASTTGLRFPVPPSATPPTTSFGASPTTPFGSTTSAPPPSANPTAQSNPYGNYTRPDEQFTRPKADYTMHLVFGILSAVMCCMPLGVAAAIYAGMAISSSNAGDALKAEQQATTAKNLTIASAATVVVSLCLYFLFVAGMVATGSTR